VWASLGQTVVAVDADPDVVERLQRGDPPVREPDLLPLLSGHRDAITFTTDFAQLARCPLVVVARDVPTDQSDASDLGPVNDLLDRALPHLTAGAALVVMSQVPPGFTRALAGRVGAARAGAGIELYYLVETLIVGAAVHRCLHPERFIVGMADPAARLHPSLRAALACFSCPVLPMRYESAELAKTAINLYLIGSVTYANTLADVCEAIGADWSEIVPALRLDRRIGPAAYLRPSLGVAGGNLERDLRTLQGLARRRDLDSRYLDALLCYNESRFDWVRSKLRTVLDRVAQPRVAIWGLAYKRDTDAIKNSPALRLIGELVGRADLRAFDPLVKIADTSGLRLGASPDDVLDGADCLVIMTDWPVFAEADLAAVRARMRRPRVIDCVGALAERRGEMTGIEYVAMGR
jgi:UDPglucose 6-dehydrogenase